MGGLGLHARAVARLVVVLSVSALLSQGALAQAEKRLALVIGNSAYKASPLPNPVNDARLMEATLRGVGFEVVKAENASRRDMQRLIRDFGEKLKQSGGVGLFYFAGHGMQVRGANYLIPVDADIRAEDEVAYDSIDAQSVLDKMESGRNRVNLLILDACRDNPFVRGSRSSAAGLAQMNAPSGSLVAYATAPGSVASDGKGANGLYTEALARAMREPGLPVEEVFKQVRVAVRRASNNQQTPWENTALEGRFTFVPGAAQAAAAPIAPAAPALDPRAADLAFWDSIKAASKPAELEAYLARFPDGLFAGLARTRLAEARAPAVSTPAAPPPGRPATAAAPAASPPAPSPTVVASIAPTPAPAAPSRAPDASRTQGTLVIKERLTNKETKIDAVPSPAEGGGTVFATGDEIAADGQVRAVRLGIVVARSVGGALWKLPLQPGTTGAAAIRVDGVAKEGNLQWSVSGTSVQVKFEYLADGSNGPVARRTGTWTGRYEGNGMIPVQQSLETRATVTGGAPDIVSGELVRTAAAAPTLPPPSVVAAGAKHTLVLKDRLTSKETRIDAQSSSAEGGGTLFGTGDEIAADGQIRAVRMGSFVVRPANGSLWKLPLQAGASGSAPIRIDGVMRPTTLTWTVADPDSAGSTVRVRFEYAVDGSQASNSPRVVTWTGRYEARLPIPVQHTMEMRAAGGPELLSGEIVTTGAGPSTAAR